MCKKVNSERNTRKNERRKAERITKVEEIFDGLPVNCGSKTAVVRLHDDEYPVGHKIC